MEYNPAEELIFPKKVEVRYSSSEYMQVIKEEIIPAGKVGIWFLGQNCFILKSDQGTTLITDPYLTDFCGSGRTLEKTEKSRILPIFIQPEDLDVDLVMITHSHKDHADPFTLERLNKDRNMQFMAPWQAVEVLKEAGIDGDKVELMHPLQKYQFKDLSITGTFAEPTSNDDLNHMGFAVQFSNGKTYYNSGDTAYTELLSHVRDFNVDFMTICINGGYHNLSHWEASKIVAEIKPKAAIPCHYDMMPTNLQHPKMFKKSLATNAPDVEYHELDYYKVHLF
ncbi:MAG: L-ascorbate 6-phosphate lactonase [bacterium]|jgi:L-ascorbate 6-phosphate lactonase